MKMYNVTQENNHTVITIAGIKFKFKNNEPQVEVLVNRNENVENVGKYTYGFQGALNYCCCETVIGNFCSIGPNVIIGPSEHDVNSISMHHFHQDMRYGGFVKQHYSSKYWTKNYMEMRKQITIKNDVWIGCNAVILKGVTIGNGAVIGAGAIVTKDIPDFAIAVGVPAKVIKYRFTEEERKLILESKWWNLKDDFLKEHIHISHNGQFFDFVKNNMELIKNNWEYIED